MVICATSQIWGFDYCLILFLLMLTGYILTIHTLPFCLFLFLFCSLFCWMLLISINLHSTQRHCWWRATVASRRKVEVAAPMTPTSATLPSQSVNTSFTLHLFIKSWFLCFFLFCMFLFSNIIDPVAEKQQIAKYRFRLKYFCQERNTHSA